MPKADRHDVTRTCPEAWERLLAAFRQVPPPENVEGCDCGMCMTSEQIRDLIEANRRRAGLGDLAFYAAHVLSTIGGPADLTCLLPGLLRRWAKELFDGCWVLSEQFHSALLRRGFFHEMLSISLREAVSDFMKEALLARMAVEESLRRQGQCRTYDWFRNFASYGVLSPDLPDLWRRWWRMEVRGHAVCAVQYVSCICCKEGENPVFAPWTGDRGGGAPVLWEYSGDAPRQCWLPENADFLRRTLTVSYLEAGLRRAMDRIEPASAKAVSAEVLETLQTNPPGWTDQRLEMLAGMLSQPGHGPLACYW